MKSKQSHLLKVCGRGACLQKVERYHLDTYNFECNICTQIYLILMKWDNLGSCPQNISQLENANKRLKNYLKK